MRVPVNGKYPDIRHLVKLFLTNLQLEFLSIISNIYLIPFCEALICLHVAMIHARIINNNINTVGANKEGCETGAKGIIYSRKPATLLPLS